MVITQEIENKTHLKGNISWKWNLLLQGKANILNLRLRPKILPTNLNIKQICVRIDGQNCYICKKENEEEEHVFVAV